MIALMDCNNFFASCERVFDLSLRKKPLVILSGNDGCIIARSNESKALGLNMCDPYFKIKTFLQQNQVQIRSTNFELYGDISRRVMTIAHSFSPDVEIYSIDEAFIYIPPIQKDNLVEWGTQLRQTILQQTSIPTSIGFATTKTLAKIANHIAKKIPSGIFIMPEDTSVQLHQTAVGDIWGIGQKTAESLLKMGIKTAQQLRDYDADLLRKKMSINLYRTVMELRGIPLLTLETQTDPPQSISYTRMFGTPITELEPLKQSIALYVAMASEKLRRNNQRARAVSFFLQKSYGELEFNPQSNMLGTTIAFPEPLNETAEILQHITPLIERLFEPHSRYRKSGVTLLSLTDSEMIQGDLFSEKPHRMNSKLYHLVDEINLKMGKRTLFHLSEGIEQSWVSKHEWISKCYTTRWKELPTVKCD